MRTRARATAVLTLFDDSTLSLEADTLIRFRSQLAAAKGARLDVELGQATLDVGTQSFALETNMGRAIIDAHSQIRLSRNGAAGRIEVVIGSARLLSEKEELALRVGDAIDIQPNGRAARVPRETSAAQTSPQPAGSSATEIAANVAAPALVVASDDSARAIPPSGPAQTDLAGTAGESFVIHDPSPPTAIALRQSGCTDAAILTLNSARGQPSETQGGASVSASVPAGTHRYAIRCAGSGEVVARGTISVIADDGSRKLANSAPVSNIDVDGRRYTILYQGRLPAVAVSWPKPPASERYTLAVRSSSGVRSFTSLTPSYVLPSGALSEGEHTLTFEAGAGRSRTTNVVLRFDNAAPTASISSPPNAGFSAGSPVKVAGVALPGWTVSVDGKELPQDAQNRFAEDVNVRSGQRALGIRFSHPSRGVHYYLRRSGQ